VTWTSYVTLGRPADALPLDERALAITEAALEPDHPDTALRLGNLAKTYRELGRSTDATLLGACEIPIDKMLSMRQRG